jgi:ricin-type beta-trefoil lectin protein
VKASCNGSAQQTWSISPDVKTGNFFVKVTSTNRCMAVRGGNTAAGAVMEVDDCNTSTASQKFAIQATVVASDTSNQTGTGGSTGGTTGTGGSGGSTSTFASSRTYRMVPQNATGESIDVMNGSQNNGTGVQQYSTWSTAGQAFYLLASGSNWKIAMSANQNKCLGPNNNGTGNTTSIVVQDCNGSTAQSYTAMKMTTSGVYAFKNVASGRCLNVAGNVTTNGALLQLYDCGTTPSTNAQFSVQ